MKIKRILPHLLVFSLSYIVKIHRIEKGNFVTWDEAHFGKFSQKYLDRTFYFDVHPPLGKMLTALSGLIFGQSKIFDFSSKENYPTAFDFEGMRRFHAFIASFTPLFGFMILRVLGFSLRRSLLLSLLFIFENGTVSISRLILLDSHLLSFTAGTLYFLTVLHMRPKNGLGEDRTLLCLGIFLGCVMSIKWIGCLTMLHVGIYIIFDLYSKVMFMDLTVFARHFLKRAFYLIAVPASIYVALFHLHFRIVNNSGPDDGFMSSEFQLGLNNSAFNGLKKFITYGKQVTIKSGHGYLHSHFHAYPDDGRDSNVNENKKIHLQVSTYSHRDKNNNFYFQKVTEDSGVDFLRDGDRVVLLHSETKGYIQGTREEAYFTAGFKVVSNRESINGAAVWVVEVFSDTVKREPFVKAISTKFYLRNSVTGCYLSSSQKNYPSWGFDQGEVLCKTAREKDCLWNVEENFFTDNQLNPPYNELRPSFFSKFVEHQVAMFNTNKSFVQDPDIEPERIVSKPYEWLILKKGLRMSQWHDGFKFYMFMNPLILYSTTACLAISPIIALLKLVRAKRKANSVQKMVALVDAKNGKQNGHSRVCGKQSAMGRDGFMLFLTVGGWALHYIPFYMVGRVLYLHHYFPALFMATLNICFVLKHVSFWKCHAFVLLCFGTFWMYSPLTYGFMKEGSLRFLRIFNDWDFVD